MLYLRLNDLKWNYKVLPFIFYTTSIDESLYYGTKYTELVQLVKQDQNYVNVAIFNSLMQGENTHTYFDIHI